jgi:glycosyltransferase involved in cell wall biosynthesis
MRPLHAAWRALPRHWRREALFGAMALVAPRPASRPDGAGPVTVGGFLSAPTGLGEGARRMLEAMREAGLAPGAADLTAALRQGTQGAPLRRPPPGPGTLVLHVNGFMQPWALAALGRRAVGPKRVIGYWAWELPELPLDWRRGFRAAHEIWVPSRFVAGAVEAAGELPVRVVPHPVPAPAPARLGRDAFGLPPGAFVALTMFDASSSVVRKNPMAAIRAHRAAFGDRPDRLLVLKTHGTRGAGGAWAEVAAAASAAPNIRILDAVLPEADRWALMAACDVLLSPHRAEGFGLAIAEAMALGRAVVATGWSGNTDFMAGPGCIALPFRLVPAEDPQATYHHPSMRWAEPDEAALADALRRLAGAPLRPPPVAFPAPDYATLLQPRAAGRDGHRSERVQA